MELTTYRATDRRVYNGAFCSDMKRESDHTKALEKRMRKADPTTYVAYFPMQDAYLAFIGDDSKILSNNFHTSKQVALIEAIEMLEGLRTWKCTYTIKQ